METMHYSEKKKSSKGAIISLFLFFLIGGTIIYLAISSEKDPVIIGSTESDFQRLVNTEKEDAIETTNKNASINFEVKDKKYNDKTNVKIKSDMTLPVISIEGEELTDINNKINSDYTDLFSKFKKQMSSADNKYTYIVSYNVYDNIVGNKRIVSVTIYQRMKDDSAKKNTMEKIESYNIDLATKEVVSLSDVAQELLGKEYKTTIKTAACDYVVEKSMMKEEEFIYAVTGLEEYYVQDGEFHIVFNESQLVDKKHGVIDVIVK